MQILPRNAEHLAFSDHLYRFNSLDHRPSRHRRPRSLHRTQPTLHLPVIGFDPVIAVAASSLPAPPYNATVELEFPDRRRIAAQAISGEYARRAVVGVSQSLFKE
jgi:hypothetical protein